NACAGGCGGHERCHNRLAGRKSDASSPLNPLTEMQRAALETRLRADLPGAFLRVYTAMRYWKPDTADALRAVAQDAITHLVLLPLYPQFSWTTSGSSFREWTKTRAELRLGGWQE